MNDFEDRSELPELDALPSEMEPPPEIEERVVSVLKQRGLIGASRGPSHRAPWWQLAAAALIAATLTWFGRGLIEPTAPPADAPVIAQQEYLLLLNEPEALQTTKPEAELVEEYRAWAIDLAGQGRLIDTGKLAPRGETLRPTLTAGTRAPTSTPTEDLDTISGYFLVRANSWDEALELARTCPHLAYGGEISVRLLEDLG
jgi:hypothetical protein